MGMFLAGFMHFLRYLRLSEVVLGEFQPFSLVLLA